MEEHSIEGFLVVPGRPVPKSPMTKRSVWVRGKRTLAYQAKVSECAKAQIPTFTADYLGIELKVWLKSPNARPGDLPSTRADYTNILKAVEDGIGYSKQIPNDRNFIRFGNGGIYPCASAKEERIEVRIWEVEDTEV